jgi:hypothetical protein
MMEMRVWIVTDKEPIVCVHRIRPYVFENVLNVTMNDGVVEFQVRGENDIETYRFDLDAVAKVEVNTNN